MVFISLRFRGRYETSKVFFLLVSFTDSYAASRRQQSVLLSPGVATGKLHLPQIIQGTIIKQARSFSCLFHLRTLMPHPGNSNLLCCFLVWRLTNYICRRSYKVPLLREQGLFLACFIYGLLCRIQETAICSAVSCVATGKPHSAVDHTRDNYNTSKVFSCLVRLRTLMPQIIQGTVMK